MKVPGISLLMRALLVYSMLFGQHSCSQVALTTREKIDGFGAQVQQIIANFCYADLHNIVFCHRPFDKMEHNYDNDPDFIAKKEDLLNFMGNIITIEQAREQGYEIQENFCVDFFNENMERCLASLEKVKRIFRANKQHLGNYFNNGRFNIAVHIRRYNPHDGRIYGSRDLPDRLYLRVINKLRKKYGHLNPLIHIYSQGEKENFKKYKGKDIVLHLNESVEDTYLGLVFADVLVTGRSSLSYTAGYLSDGIVYYNFYRGGAPLPQWKSVTELLQE